jgi:succinylglutamate desuccinylase
MVAKKHICNKEKEITTLEVTQKSMSDNITEIKIDIKEMKNILQQLTDQILIAPQKFAEKEHFDEKIKDYTEFKNSINVKIAYIS